MFSKKVVSFTNLVTEVLSGNLSIFALTHLLDKPVDPDTNAYFVDKPLFFFGCAREHVFRSDNLIPYEAGWTSPRVPPVGDSQGIPLEALDDDRRERFVALMQVLTEADQDGRINWRVGNYLALIETFQPGDLVVYGNQVAAAYNWQPAAEERRRRLNEEARYQMQQEDPDLRDLERLHDAYYGR